MIITNKISVLLNYNKVKHIIKLILVMTLFKFNTSVVNCFNFDTFHYAIHTGENGSMFGFTVAQYKFDKHNLMLIGAPEATTKQPGITKGGAIFKCYLDKKNCEELVFDKTGNNDFGLERVLDHKSNQWFGSTLRSSSENGNVVACASRYVSLGLGRKVMERFAPIGTCFIATKGLSKFSEYSPCRQTTKNLNPAILSAIEYCDLHVKTLKDMTKLNAYNKAKRQFMNKASFWPSIEEFNQIVGYDDILSYKNKGVCQAGFAADFSKKGDYLFIGAVGMRSSEGRIFSKNIVSNLEYDTPPKILSNTTEISADSYFGYSVVTGNFGGRNGSTDVAASMPKAELVGKVIIYTATLKYLEEITGQQLGAYFGYSLCSVDINADGLDDIIVGAPLYTDYNYIDHTYETGRVNVYYQSGKGKGRFKVTEMDNIDGFKAKGRFGLAITSLGDINKDSFPDIAIAAPYQNEMGAVYIFHGSPKGIITEPKQMITPQLFSKFITSFGFSLSGGYDLDNNGYPDLLIGAYESDSSIFLRTRPIVNVTSSFYFDIKPKEIGLEPKNCTKQIGSRRTSVACLSQVTVKACFKYNGINIKNNLDLNVSVVLDTKKQWEPRMFFLNENDMKYRITFTKQLKKDSALSCESMAVYVKPSIMDKQTSFEAKMNYSLIGEEKWKKSGGSYTGRKPESPFPVLSDNEEPFKNDSIQIKKNCGSDDKCTPNLRLKATPSDSYYILGSGASLGIEVFVENIGEDSFGSVLRMSIPENMDYVRTENNYKNSEIPVKCSAPSLLNNCSLLCDIGDPLQSKKFVKFKILLEPYNQVEFISKYDFNLSVNSTDPENKANFKDNFQNISIPLQIKTDLILTDRSSPNELQFNNSLYNFNKITHESQIGPQIIHTYKINSKGPSNVKTAEVEFDWPSYTNDGEPFLYLLEPPSTCGSVVCEPILDINPWNVTIIKENYLKNCLQHADNSSDFLPRGYNKDRCSSRQTRAIEISPNISRHINHLNDKESTNKTNGHHDVHNRNEDKLELNSNSSQEVHPMTKVNSNRYKCGPKAECIKIKCIVGPIIGNKEIIISFRSRISVDAIKEFPKVKLSSKVTAKILPVPGFGKQEYINRSREISTIIEDIRTIQNTSVIPLWMVVLASYGGSLILIIIILLLYWCGFFKRNRPLSENGTLSDSIEVINCDDIIEAVNKGYIEGSGSSSLDQ